jgi:hypothetical protein
MPVPAGYDRFHDDRLANMLLMMVLDGIIVEAAVVGMVAETVGHFAWLRRTEDLLACVEGRVTPHPAHLTF